MIRFLIPFLFATSILAQTAQYRHDGKALLPDDKATPGVVALTDQKKICAVKWGKDERAVTAKMKAEVYATYGAKPNAGICKPVPHKTKKGKMLTPVSGCEVDHRISREIGGADDVRNLWIQPYLTPDQPGAYEKDALENYLHRQVCTAKTMTLDQAQTVLKGDWYAAYRKYMQ